MLTPVADPDTGEISHYDIWVAGQWVGSRRTIAQCVERLRFLEWPSSVLAGASYRIEHGSPHRIVFNPP